MLYPVRTPRLFSLVYPGCTWSVPDAGRAVYLSFDDGPEPEVTPRVLDLLGEAGVRASFFCIGKNVEAHPRIFDRIRQEGHAVGNHSFSHLNGWKTDDATYLADIARAAEIIPTALFRPPYGRARRSQMKQLMASPLNMKIIMWTLLSGDFDTGRSADQCWVSVDKHLRPGQIVTFHDSLKAAPRLLYVLPKLLQKMRDEKLEGRALEM